LWTSQTEWSRAMEWSHGSGPRNCFSPNRHDHSEHISYTQFMWWQNDAQSFREILVRELISHSQEANVTASSRGRPSPTASQLS